MILIKWILNKYKSKMINKKIIISLIKLEDKLSQI